MTASPSLNGTKRSAALELGPWQPIRFDRGATVWEKQPEPEAPAEPAIPAADPRAEAEAEAIRIAAVAEAKAKEIKAVEEARKLKLANDKAEQRAREEQAASEARIAKKADEEKAAKAAKEKADKAAAEQAVLEAQRAAEQARTESWWKWGARIIYTVGLVIAAPVQFMHFWDRQRPFLVAAPALLEGLALVLALGAAWAVAHRRDVMPYRIGIMLGAVIAAGINMYGGLSDPRIGFNAGLIGAIASLGGPIVLMAYEHGIAQKADGIPSFRERRAADKAKAKEVADRAAAKAEKDAAAKKAADEKAEQQKASEVEQQRKDDDRKANHPEVWERADSIRSARGSATVTESIWAEAWHRVTGSKMVGVTPEIEELSRLAQARMKEATEIAPGDSLSQVDSQKAPRPKRDPDAPDGRRFNGGTPPRRTPGDTAPYSPLAKTQAALEQTTRTDAN